MANAIRRSNCFELTTAKRFHALTMQKEFTVGIDLILGERTIDPRDAGFRAGTRPVNVGFF